MMRYLLSFHILSLLLLAMLAISFGLAFFLPLMMIFEIIIFLYARDNVRLFFFMWQLSFFIMLLMALLMRPHELFNFNEVPPMAQPIFIAFLVIVELIIAALCFLGEKVIKTVLLGSTTVMIIAVLVVIALIGSEGMMGFLENDPIDMLTSTEWSPNYDGALYDYVDIPMVVKPYDFDVATNNSVVHAPPGKEVMISLIIRNMGALEDSYSITVTADSGVDMVPLPGTITVSGNNVSEVSLTLCSLEAGSFNVEAQAKSEKVGEKTVDIRFEVSDMGIEIDREYEKSVTSGPDVSLVKFPLRITNTGSTGVNITFKVETSSPGSFIPKLMPISGWNYTLSEGHSYLKAGQALNYSFHPQYKTTVDGIYDIWVNITVDGTNVKETYHLVLDHKLTRLAWSLNDWPLPLYDGTNTALKVAIGDYRISEVQASIPVGCSATAMINGTEVPLTEEWIGLGLNRSGAIILTLYVTTSEEETSEMIFGVKTTGTQPSFGMAAFMWGTAATVSFALLFSVPLALGSAIYLSEYAPSRLRRGIKPVMEILAGIPSVVYGLWGGLTLGPMLSTTLYPFISSTLGSVIPFFFAGSAYTPLSLFTASIILSIMIFPIIMSLSYDALNTVPSELKHASLATGASKWQTVRRVTMVKARSGIMAAVVLAMGRAVGETMAVLMIMGSTPKIPGSIFGDGGTMTSVLASNFGINYFDDVSRHGLFTVAFVLFLIVFIINTVFLSITREHGSDRTNPLIRRFKAVKRLVIGRLAGEAETKDIRSQFRSSARSALLDKLVKWALYACTAVILVIVAYIIGDVIIRGGSSLKLSYLLETESWVTTGGGGFLNAIAGSLILVAIAIGIAASISVMSAIYVNEYSNKKSPIVRMTAFATSTLAATPSIIYGIFGLTLFVVYFKFGFSLLSGALTLALMATPLIFTSALEGLKAVPDTFREASCALGVSKWATIKNVILPVSFSSVTSGIIIATGRIIGDTAAVMLTAGYATWVVDSLFGPAASLPNMIYKYYSFSFIFSNIEGKLYAVSFVMIAIIVVLNLAARLIASWSQKRMGIKAGDKSW